MMVSSDSSIVPMPSRHGFHNATCSACEAAVVAAPKAKGKGKKAKGKSPGKSSKAKAKGRAKAEATKAVSGKPGGE